MPPLSAILKDKVRRVSEAVQKPTIFDCSISDDCLKLEALLQNEPTLEVFDTFVDQKKELLASQHPELRFAAQAQEAFWSEFLAQNGGSDALWQQGSWIFLPWRKALIHTLGKEDFRELRTSRNRNLISGDEQTLLRSALIGIAGLSVGSSVSMALALAGFSQLRIADFDELSLSNLNRIRAGVQDIGKKKATLAAEALWKMDPYLELSVFEDGIPSIDLARDFLVKPSRLSVFVDEMDDVAMKIEMRKIAREMRIPVVSAADNGDNVILDVERFDQEPERPLYHGRLPSIDDLDLSSLTFPQRFRLINDIVGAEWVTERMKSSLMEVGKTLYTWPQLGGTAMMSGAMVALLCRKIVLKEPLLSGKYEVNLERIFTPEYENETRKQQRDLVNAEFLAFQEALSDRTLQ